MSRGLKVVARALPLAIVLSWGASTGSAQSGAANGEWRTYGGDLGSTRYSSLDQINGDNFEDLEVMWRFKTSNLGPYPDFNYQATPLMIDGVLYAPAGSRRHVVALDAATGEMLWMYRLDEGERGANAIRRMSGRGVAYWTDGQGDERIFFVTIGYQLVGLDAKTGRHGPFPGSAPTVSSISNRTMTSSSIRSPVRSVGTAPRSWPATSSSWARRTVRAGRPRAARTSRGTSAASMCAPASDSGSSTPFRDLASSGVTRG